MAKTATRPTRATQAAAATAQAAENDLDRFMLKFKKDFGAADWSGKSWIDVTECAEQICAAAWEKRKYKDSGVRPKVVPAVKNGVVDPQRAFVNNLIYAMTMESAVSSEERVENYFEETIAYYKRRMDTFEGGFLRPAIDALYGALCTGYNEPEEIQNTTAFGMLWCSIAALVLQEDLSAFDADEETVGALLFGNQCRIAIFPAYLFLNDLF